METNNKLIFYTSTCLNASLSIALVMDAIFSMINNPDSIILPIILIVVGALFLISSVLFFINAIIKESFELNYPRIALLCTSAVSLICFILFFLNLNIVFYIVFGIEFVVSTIFLVLALSHSHGKLKYNHARRNQRLAPTHTIQISTDFLIKDSYTKEEAEKTLQQLYSIHDQKGFSLEDYENIKEKILNNTKQDD